ncbi:MAG: DUF1223 domain-containing protein [Gammaproteobacteria bacterium]
MACAAIVVSHGTLAANPAAEFSSGEQQVTVIELFTSEGCSSCPPADRWFSELKQDPGLWREFVPLAFHVDYWDYIGWRDRLAAPEFAARQRQYASSGGVSTVYTPGFIVNGQEWRGWFRGHSRPGSSLNVGALHARFDDDTVSIRFEPLADEGRYVAHAALLGADLATEVRAGENRGHQLRHDFVVIAQRQVDLSADGAAHAGRVKFEPAATGANVPAALAVWVTPVGELAPLQATGGWLPRQWRARAAPARILRPER